MEALPPWLKQPGTKPQIVGKGLARRSRDSARAREKMKVGKGEEVVKERSGPGYKNRETSIVFLWALPGPVAVGPLTVAVWAFLSPFRKKNLLLCEIILTF